MGETQAETDMEGPEDQGPCEPDFVIDEKRLIAGLDPLLHQRGARGGSCIFVS